jgi:hypothetical protein
MYRRTQVSNERSPFTVNRKYGLISHKYNRSGDIGTSGNLNNKSDWDINKTNKIKDLLKSKITRGTSATRYRDLSEESYEGFIDSKYEKGIGNLHQTPCVPQVTLATPDKVSLKEKSSYQMFQAQVKVLNNKRKESSTYHQTSKTMLYNQNNSKLFQKKSKLQRNVSYIAINLTSKASKISKIGPKLSTTKTQKRFKSSKGEFKSLKTFTKISKLTRTLSTKRKNNIL